MQLLYTVRKSPHNTMLFPNAACCHRPTLFVFGLPQFIKQVRRVRMTLAQFDSIILNHFCQPLTAAIWCDSPVLMIDYLVEIYFLGVVNNWSSKFPCWVLFKDVCGSVSQVTFRCSSTIQLRLGLSVFFHKRLEIK